MKYLKVNDLCQKLIDLHKKYMLTDLEVKVTKNESKSIKTRNIKLENIENSSSLNFVLNVYKGKKRASIRNNNFEQINEIELLERASSMVNSLPEEAYSSLPDATDYPNNIKNLDIYDNELFSEKKLKDMAMEAEEAMLETKNITNTEGATASVVKKSTNIFSSRGFSASYKKSLNSISAIAIAGKDMNMQRDYEFATSTHMNDLPVISTIGKKAANRASSRLMSKKIKSCTLDVVFEPRVAKSILSSFSSCINGNSIARGTSFLIGKKNKSIFRKGINITNNPLKKRCVGSVPYDYNGVRNSNLYLVKDGVLDNYFLNTRTARQLNMKPNGNSSPYNLILENGKSSAEELIKSIDKGFYVTEMLGMSFNQVTGDYSRGATGFMIENGIITYPVSEVTIADNMKNMLMKLLPANDLVINENINTPTILIEKMSLAGI